MKNLFNFSLTMLLIGCSALTGEEVGRLAINQVSTEDSPVSKEVSVELKAGDEIVLWSDMDMEYEGNVSILFKTVITKDGKQYRILEIDPTQKDVTLNQSQVTIDNKTSWSFFGQNAIFRVHEDGQYTFQAILMATENSTLKIKKAELVLKKL